MDVYAEEHEDLRRAVRGLLEKDADSGTVRGTIAAGSGYDATLWRRMCDELGLAGLALPTSVEGSGYGRVELAVVLEEIGRANLPSPYLATVLAGLSVAADAAAAAGGEPLTSWARGERSATVHLDDTAAVDLTDGCASGIITHLLDGPTADDVVVVGPRGGAVIALDGPGATRRPLETMDLTRGQARVELADAPARALDVPERWADRVRADAAVLLACEQVGGAERVLELSTEYARTRVQFGRAIGSFQAVKHLLADMLIELELARGAQRHALALATDPDATSAALGEAAAVARVACSRAFCRLTADAVRVHGGIGFTWEHDAHLYFRRSRTSAVLFGAPDGDLDDLATHAGLPREGAP